MQYTSKKCRKTDGTLFCGRRFKNVFLHPVHIVYQRLCGAVTQGEGRNRLYHIFEIMRIGISQNPHLA